MFFFKKEKKKYISKKNDPLCIIKVPLFYSRAPYILNLIVKKKMT